MGYGVLLIEDEAILAKKIAKYLTKNEFEVRLAGTGQDGLDALSQFLPDAIILDFNLPGELNGLDVLERIHSFDAGIKVIMVTGQGNVRLAVDAMKAGAYDYLSKPIVLSELKLLLDRAISENRKAGQMSYFQDKQATAAGIDQIVGQSSSILQMKEQISRINESCQRIQSGTPPAALITGETGTGKELVARAIHFSGARKEQAFIELNAATIPNHLVESELFGYERGAFTDAHQRKLGLVEAADGGTLFLDEIGELDLVVQAKLLKLLEDQTVRRLGSLRDCRVNIQIVTATNRSLLEMVEQGKFRQDLYYRLNTLSVIVPPLRERTGDIALLAQHFIEQMKHKYGKPHLVLSAGAQIAMQQYGWPGNVRELRNAIEQAVLQCADDEITPAQFNFPVTTSTESKELEQSTVAESDADVTLPEMERILIEKTLQEVDGNVSKAARRLGISRDRLRYKIEKYHIERRR